MRCEASRWVFNQSTFLAQTTLKQDPISTASKLTTAGLESPDTYQSSPQLFQSTTRILRLLSTTGYGSWRFLFIRLPVGSDVTRRVLQKAPNFRKYWTCKEISRNINKKGFVAKLTKFGNYSLFFGAKCSTRPKY